MAGKPYELIADPDKTTITSSGGITLGYGLGPGLGQAKFWNRIGSLFSCHRPAVALLNVFTSDDLHQPLALRRVKSDWHPNHAQADYSAPGLRVSENRFASKCGLHCRLKLRNTRSRPVSLILCFHGSVEQWPFFDYPRVSRDGTDTMPPPKVQCEINPKRREVTITQPHPHHGLPQVVNSIQRVWVELPGNMRQQLASCGFGLNESDLRTLWHDHSVLANIRMRLGQVGGRYSGSADKQMGGATVPVANRGDASETLALPTDPIELSHPHPLYYLTIRLELEPGEEREVILRTDYHTNDEGGDLRSKPEQQRRYPKPDVALKREAAAWRKYLSSEVPQLDCDDKALVRYWYYVWYVLRSNRTAPGKHITHAFTAPSKYMYWGSWIWDGYFHVLGEMWLKDPQIAQDSIRSVLDMQFPNGFIPVCSGSNYRMCFHEDIPGYKNPQGGGFASYVEPELKGYRELKHPFEAEITTGASPAGFIHNEKTQSPLIAHAAYNAFGNRLYSDPAIGKIRDYDEWLWRRRTDDMGRFVLWHGDESGWDDATRHYPVPALPFDVQLHLTGSRNVVAHFDEDDDRFQSYWRALQTYWDRGDKWFYDFGAAGDGKHRIRRRRQITPGALSALGWNIRKSQSQALIDSLNRKQIFDSPFPIPTLARCDPDYAPHGWGWNGPVWLQINYFTITGLLAENEYQAASDLWDKTRDLIIRNGKPNSYELYDPESGTGMGCPDYSWQAMVNHLIIRHFAGVYTDRLKPQLPPSINMLRIRNLPGAVGSIKLKRNSRSLKMKLELNEQKQPGLPDRFRYWPPWIDCSGLGRVASVHGNNRAFNQTPDGLWEPPDDAPCDREWEIIIKCR